MKKVNLFNLGLMLILASFLIAGMGGCKKNKGCTDPTSINYDPDAEEDDGSCEYIDQDQVNYDAASIVNGGRLYYKFYSDETNWTAPAGITDTDITGYANFYLCKQCHGWDQLGSAGAYIDRGPTTSRPNVASVNIHSYVESATIKQVFDGIKNTGGRTVDTTLTQDGTNGQGDPMPDYGAILTDSEIWDLVKFLKEGALDVTQLYDIVIVGTYPTGSRTFENVGKDGDAAAGGTFYTGNCGECHGVDGNTLTPSIGKSMGEFARTKPYEMQHKSVYGQPGSIMTGATSASATDIKNMFKALADTTNFPD